MPQSVLVELELPKDWDEFRLPPALHDRLQELLDRQDREGKLSKRERREADTRQDGHRPSHDRRFGNEPIGPGRDSPATRCLGQAPTRGINAG